MLLSLVPTQLRRLLAHPEGCSWLQAMDVIWVGGAALPLDLAALSRQAGLRLAPCYGATETAAMVTVQTPQAFLAGHRSCGQPLEGVRLRLDPDGALAVHCDRLAVARLDPAGGLQALVDAQGGGAPVIWRHLATLRSPLICRLWVAAMVRCNPVASRSFLSSWRIVCCGWRIRLVCPSQRC